MDRIDLNRVEERIDEYLGSKNDLGVRFELGKMTPEEIASIISGLGHGKKKVFRSLPVPVQQEVIWEVNKFSRRSIISSLTVNELLDLLSDMDSDDASDIVALVPGTRRETLLSNLPKRDSRDITSILEYGPESAGSIMQTEMVKVPESFTVTECTNRIRRLRNEVKKAYVVFVTDAKGRYLGYFLMEALLMADQATRVGTLIQGRESIPVDMDREEAAHVFKEADLPVLPVVDDNGRLIGRITSDDIVDVIEEEHTEDVYRLGGVDKEESATDPATIAVRRRFLWLLINLGTAILAAMTVGLFSDTINRFVILAAYMPIVAGMGGNAITQVITVLVRGIAIHEVERRNLSRILAKEFTIGIINGIALGLIMGLVSYAYNGLWMLGVVIFLAMVANLLIAAICGTLIPITLKALKLDPALSSCVIATTCTDVGGFFAFLGLASILL